MPETKLCPFCAEEIKAAAVKCKHCGTWLPSPQASDSTSAPGGYRRLVRSSSDRMIAGICGGLAEYLGVDSTAIRLLAVILLFFTALIPMLLIYIVLIFVIPAEH